MVSGIQTKGGCVQRKHPNLFSITFFFILISDLFHSFLPTHTLLIALYLQKWVQLCFDSNFQQNPSLTYEAIHP